MLPTITNYGQYSNDNYGKHTLKVDSQDSQIVMYVQSVMKIYQTV